LIKILNKNITESGICLKDAIPDGKILIQHDVRKITFYFNDVCIYKIRKMIFFTAIK